MDVAAAQQNISAAYVGGAPSVLVSGLVWLTAGIVEQGHDATAAFTVLFFGGMLIVPAALMIGRLLFGAGKVTAGNPLERLGLETTVMLFAGILLAYVLLRVAPELAFSALAVAIGARYFSFRTIYGEPTYWVLGALLASIGTVGLLRAAPLPLAPLLLVGIAECVFAALLLARWRGKRPDLAPERAVS